MNQEFTIDLNQPYVEVIQAIQRAYYFAGIVCKKANLEKLSPNHPLPGFMLFPDHSSENTEELTNQFSAFVTNNCVREIIEAIATYLDDSYYNLERIKTPKTAAPTALKNSRKAKNRFTMEKFPIKIQLLNESLSKNNKISLEGENFLIALQDLRNCLSHKRGKLDKDNVSLCYPCFEAVTKDEKVLPINSFPFELNTGFHLRISYEQRIFLKNEIIQFTHKEIALICFQAKKTCDELRNNIIKTAQVRGLVAKPIPVLT